MDKFEKDEYKEELNSMKKKLPGTLGKYHLADLPKEWLPLYRYKGKYYVYSPGEYEGRTFSTDTTMMFDYGWAVSPTDFICCSGKPTNLAFRP